MALLRKEAVPLAVLAVATGVIVLLFVFPAYLVTGSGCPTYLTAHGRSYCAEYVTLEPEIVDGTNAAVGCTMGFTFQHVLFALTFSGDIPYGVDAIGGWVSAPSASCMSAGLYYDPASGATSVNWSSPDQSVYILWNSPFFAQVDGTSAARFAVGVYIPLA